MTTETNGDMINRLELALANPEDWTINDISDDLRTVIDKYLVAAVACLILKDDLKKAAKARTRRRSG